MLNLLTTNDYYLNNFVLINLIESCKCNPVNPIDPNNLVLTILLKAKSRRKINNPKTNSNNHYSKIICHSEY